MKVYLLKLVVFHKTFDKVHVKIEKNEKIKNDKIAFSTARDQNVYIMSINKFHLTLA